MTPEELQSKAARLFPYHSRATAARVDAIRRKWIAAINAMGNKWLLARPINKRKGT